jgi:predicted acetyltransferase
MKIREITADERADVSLPIQEYAFRASPADAELRQRQRKRQEYSKGHVTLVAEEGGAALAAATAIPMQQNVRGRVYPMAGIASVATLPLARRRGFARALVSQLLGQMRDTGHVVSALYPFRPSFYERFGYAGLPRTRTVRFAPEGVAGLVRAGLPGEVTWTSAREGYPAYREFTQRLLAEQHGFCVHPEYRAVELRDADDCWLVMAYSGGEAVGALTYTITGHGEVLAADDMLTANALGRALLLEFFARHVDQVREVEVRIGPAEFPELWATDITAVIRAEVSFPGSAAPMARVLSLSALAGMQAGQERVVVEIAGDPYIGGSHVLDGRSGSLEVAPADASASEATLTAAGLSALVYGVLDPDDLVVRGLGDIPADAAERLRVLFPRLSPYLYATF